MKIFKRLGLAVALMLALSVSAHGQTVVPGTAVNLSLAMNESVTVTATPGSITFGVPVSGTSTASGPITVTTTWSLLSTRTMLHISSYLGSVTAALSSGGANIPAADVYSTETGSTLPCTQGDSAFPNVGAQCGWYAPAGSNSSMVYTGTNNTAVTLSLQNLPASLAAGTYTGVLTFVAEYN
jgi:hypothetical protein